VSEKKPRKKISSPYVNCHRPARGNEIDLVRFPEVQASLSRVLDRTYRFDQSKIRLEGHVDVSQTEATLEVWFDDRKVHNWTLRDLSYGGHFTLTARKGYLLEECIGADIPGQLVEGWLSVAGYPPGYPCRVDVATDARNALEVEVLPFS